MKQSRKKRQAIKQRQKMYVNNWNIGQSMKYYDALDDKYATYYFANSNVKKHFKHFEKAVKKEPKTVDLLRMTFLVQNKYKKGLGSRDASIKSKQADSLNDSLVKSYQGALKPKSLEKLRKINKYQLQPEENDKNQNKIDRAQSFQERLPKVKNPKVFLSRNQQKLPNLPSKNSFVEYLEKRKEEIEKKQ